MRGPKIESWIKAGYKLLGQEGLDGVKVEKLAHTLDLNKSGFYHYFGSMKSYVKTLLQYHISQARAIAAEMAGCEKIDPDLLLLIVKYKIFILVESQLVLKSKSLSSFKDLEEASKILSEAFLDLWRRSSGTKEIPKNINLTSAYLNVLRHFFYAQINPENINYKFLRTLIIETKGVLENASMDKT